jgi:regulator of protease activity HflC (stomatin/prohibitin superfamily)
VGRTLDEMLDALPKSRRAKIDRRYRELRDEVESLQQLRRAVGRAQMDIAAALRIKQPSVSKIEKQTDLYLSTLRSYVEALGGKLELVVRLPAHRPLRIRQLGQVTGGVAATAPLRGSRLRPGSSRSGRAKRTARG